MTLDDIHHAIHRNEQLIIFGDGSWDVSRWLEQREEGGKYPIMQVMNTPETVRAGSGMASLAEFLQMRVAESG